MVAKEKGVALVEAPSASLPVSAGGPLRFESITNDLYSSFPADQKAETIRLMQGGAEPLDTQIGKRIAVQHVVAHRVTIIDADGVPIPSVRIVLASGNGKAYYCVSAGVKEAVGCLGAFYGTPPLSPALELMVGQVKTRRGFKTYTLT